MPRFWHPPLPTVSRTGAPAGCVLAGSLPRNKGLRIRVAHAQPGGTGASSLGAAFSLAGARTSSSTDPVAGVYVSACASFSRTGSPL